MKQKLPADRAKAPVPKVSVGSLRVRFAPVGPLAGGLPDVPHGPPPPYGPGAPGSSPAAAETGMRMMVASRSSWDEAAAPSALEAQVAQMRQYARAADAEDPEVRKIGFAGLRRLAAQLLEADTAVRKLRAMRGDDGMHRLVQYAKEPGSGYPPPRGHLARFVDRAAKRLDTSERNVQRWLAKAKKENLLP